MDIEDNKRVFNRLGRHSNDLKQQRVCYHWKSGNCRRFPCPFLHRELPPPDSNGVATKRSLGSSHDVGAAPNRRNGPSWGRGRGGSAGGRGIARKSEKVCNFWMQGSCSYGERCKFTHSWSIGDSFSFLTQLEGHQKVITGITFPPNSDKLYSGSKDETVRVWNCQSGQCMGVVNLGGEVGCIISEASWVFVGLPNLVKAWNTHDNSEHGLSGPVGQVYALVVGNGLLLAGTQDGTILGWKFNSDANCFEPSVMLKGHNLAVVSLVVGSNLLFSGSMDNSVRVWSLESLQCVQTLNDHTSVVMSLLCWDKFLLSSSLDQTIKVWAAAENGHFDVTYTHKEEHGVLALCGLHDLEAKPVLMCSCNDNLVRAYDLPSFSERGKIFTKQEVRCIQPGPGGSFFTGDGAGDLRVWKWGS